MGAVRRRRRASYLKGDEERQDLIVDLEDDEDSNLLHVDEGIRGTLMTLRYSCILMAARRTPTKPIGGEGGGG